MPRHFVVVKNLEGSPEMAPLKEWLRNNPQLLPPGRDANEDTTYQLRRALRKAGWEMEELPDKVLLIRPDESGDTSFAEELLVSSSETPAAQQEQ